MSQRPRTPQHQPGRRLRGDQRNRLQTEITSEKQMTRENVTCAAFGATNSENAKDICRNRDLAERVGFEPTCRLPDKTLSRRPRYDHFGTSPIDECQKDLLL